MKKRIDSPLGPAAFGPFSQAIDTGAYVFVSGQLPIVRATGNLSGDDVESQTRQCLENIRVILAEAGLTLNDVCKARVLLTDMNDFEVVNKIYAEYFDAPFPARAAIGVVSLAKGAKVEIEAIAARP